MLYVCVCVLVLHAGSPHLLFSQVAIPLQKPTDAFDAEDEYKIQLSFDGALEAGSVLLVLA